MFLPSAVFMLLSSLHAIVVASTVAKHVNHNLTELLATTAITANLSMLDEIQADMTKFVNSAKTLYTKHFLDDHIGTAESALDASLKAEIHTVHDYFLDLFGSAFVLNNSTCAFAPYVIALCGEATPRLGLFRTILQSEVLRTRRCAMTVSRVHAQIDRLREDYLENTSYFMSRRIGFQPSIAYSFRLTQEQNLEQSYELKKRFLEFWTDLQDLEMLTLRLPTIERSQYLQDLEQLYRTAGSDASDAICLGDPILQDNYSAMKIYWNEICRSARGSLAETYDSTFSSWKSSAEDSVKYWIMRGFVFKEQWAREGFGRARGW